MSVKKKMTALADEIRAKTGKEEALSLDAMAENIGEVYTAGAKSEYDAFWDKYQMNGNKTTYNYAFAYWSKDVFMPKYDIIPITTTGIFYGFNSNNVEAFDLKQALSEWGISLDFSQIVGVTSYAFWSSNISALPELDFRSASSFEGTFSRSKVQTIEKLILNENGKQNFGSTFSYCVDLKEISIIGSVGNDFDIHWSPLSKKSILSIFTALSDISDGKTISFSLPAVNKAFETAEGAGDGSTSDEWNDLLKTKLNWTVVLV